MQATPRNERRRKSAEWIGCRITTTPVAPTTTTAANSQKKKRAGSTSLLLGRVDRRLVGVDAGVRLHVPVPLRQLRLVEVERLVPLVDAELVRLRGEPDRA